MTRAECPKCHRMAESLVVVESEPIPVICDRCALALVLPPGMTLPPDRRPIAPGYGPR